LNLSLEAFEKLIQPEQFSSVHKQIEEALNSIINE